MGYSPESPKESDMTEQPGTHEAYMPELRERKEKRRNEQGSRPKLLRALQYRKEIVRFGVREA